MAIFLSPDSRVQLTMSKKSNLSVIGNLPTIAFNTSEGAPYSIELNLYGQYSEYFKGHPKVVTDIRKGRHQGKYKSQQAANQY